MIIYVNSGGPLAKREVIIKGGFGCASSAARQKTGRCLDSSDSGRRLFTSNISRNQFGDGDTHVYLCLSLRSL